MENDPPASIPPPSPPEVPTPPPPTPSLEPPPVPAAEPPPVPPPAAEPSVAATQAQAAQQAFKQAAAETANEFANEKNLAMFCHLAAIVGGLVFSWTGLPVGNIVGPLLIWLWKKDSMPLVNEHGKESLNFQITVSIAIGACLALFFLFLPLLLIPLIGIAALVLTILGTIKASNGVLYRYPFALRLIK